MTQEQLKELFLHGQLLTEMFLHGTIESNKYIIGFNKDIFIFDEIDQDEIMKEVVENITKHFNHMSHEYRNNNIYRGWNIFEIFSDLKRLSYDTFCGQFYDEHSVIIYGNKFRHSPISSLFLAKLAKQLNIKTWITDDSFENNGYEYIDAKTKIDFPDIGFHATSSRYLTSILHNGLESNRNNGNWSRIVQNSNHKNTIFFSTNNEILLYYANHAKRLHQASPIIVEFKIPNKDYIVQEFEMERATGNPNQIRYELSNTPNTDKRAISTKPLSLSKEMGIYGYTHRISSFYITAFWIPKEIHNEGYIFKQTDFKRVLPKNVATELKMFTI